MISNNKFGTDKFNKTKYTQPKADELQKAEETVAEEPVEKEESVADWLDSILFNKTTEEMGETTLGPTNRRVLKNLTIEGTVAENENARADEPQNAEEAVENEEDLIYLVKVDETTDEKEEEEESLDDWVISDLIATMRAMIDELQNAEEALADRIADGRAMIDELLNAEEVVVETKDEKDEKEELIDWLNWRDSVLFNKMSDMQTETDELQLAQPKSPAVVEIITENARKAKKKIVNGLNGVLAMLGF